MIEMKHIAMLIAERAARQSNCKKRQVAFVAFNDKGILKVGVNQHAPDKPCQCVDGVHDPDVEHAERVIEDEWFPDSQAVVTYAPCYGCAVELAPSGINTVFIKHVKHEVGIKHLHKNRIVTHNEWLTPMQRIQAAWLLKWTHRQYEEYL